MLQNIQGHQRCWWPSGEPALLGFNKIGVLTGETTGCDHPNSPRPPRTTRAGFTFTSPIQYILRNSVCDEWGEWGAPKNGGVGNEYY